MKSPTVQGRGDRLTRESTFSDSGRSALPAGVEIVDVRRIENGKILAKATVEVESLGEIDILIFDGRQGAFASVAAGTARDGSYAKPVRFAPGVASAIAYAALDALEQSPKRKQPPPSGRDGALFAERAS